MHFDWIDRCVPHSLEAVLHHGEPVNGIGAVSQLEGLGRRGNDHEAVERQRSYGILGNEQMPYMRRVEASAKDAESHWPIGAAAISAARDARSLRASGPRGAM